ncbi:MAG: A24 family peptidase [Firmicutes bacterium]|nr:A24 family peptidase [Bacillota bacterium]
MEELLCLVGIASLVWILMSDLRRMVVPVVPLALLAGSGAAWGFRHGTWEDMAYSAVIVMPFLYLYFRKGLGEGDILMLFALSPWFHPKTYLPVLISGFVLGTVWGAVRLARAGELKGWLCRVNVGVMGEIPERSEEALSRAECVPLAAALSLPALAAVVIEYVRI